VTTTLPLVWQWDTFAVYNALFGKDKQVAGFERDGMLDRGALSFLVMTILPIGWLGTAPLALGQAFEPLGGGFGGGAQDVVKVSAEFTTAQGDEPARLFITATIKEGWHIYSVTQPPGGPVATKITLAESDAYKVVGEWRVAPAPETKPEPAFGGLMVESHHGVVTWFAPIEPASGVDPAELQIAGKLEVQPCDASSCLPPTDVPFEAVLGKGVDIPEPTSVPPLGSNRFDPESVETQETVEAKSMAVALVFAFFGGLILNIMPCVLPVIGLKILSFFQQAGKSRGRAFMLNVWYSLGLMSVFIVLAALGVGLSEMFTARLFGIIMACVVFAMALSLMGLWELRVPSFLGGGKAAALSEQEGVLGAFFKGIITTLLAIPCGAPLLSPALKWADGQVRAGAPQNVYLTFAVIGLGMASPYLIIGAFPELLRFLPKPGEWMETFKKTMGYLLLVAVVWILYFLPEVDVVPTIGLLFGLWFACWIVGRLPVTASLEKKVWAWALGIAIVVLAGAISFQLLRADTEHWIPYDRATFDRLTAERKTVLIDFTADWCMTCKALERFVLDTGAVHEVLEKNSVVTMQADWTNGDPEVTEMMNILGSKQVPVVAIFPAGAPNRPIVFRGGFTQQKLLDALKEAGPSRQ